MILPQPLLVRIFLCITLLSEISGISNPLGEEFTTLLLFVNTKLDLSPARLEYRETEMLARGHVLAFFGKDATKYLKNIRTYIFQVVACLQTKALLLLGSSGYLSYQK
jgi:hypothetical protein